jgi:hypothetical protein
LTESDCPRPWNCQARALSCSTAECTLVFYQQRLAQLSKCTEFLGKQLRNSAFASQGVHLVWLRSGHGKGLCGCRSQVKYTDICHLHPAPGHSGWAILCTARVRQDSISPQLVQPVIPTSALLQLRRISPLPKRGYR